MTWLWLCWGCGAGADPAVQVPEPTPPRQEPAKAPPTTPKPAEASAVVEVFFLDEQAVNDGGDPFRTVQLARPPGDLGVVAQAVVDATYGPTEPGLVTLRSGSTGAVVTVEGDVATVRLEGGCSGGALSIHDQLERSLEALDGIGHVRTVGPGEDVPGPERRDVRADCLQP